jgi:hypothetical protein
MAVVISANQSLATNTVPLWMWQIISFLVASAGWTQYGSGDGATYANGSAGPVAGGGAGALGMGDSGSWVRLRKTIGGVVYELLFYSGGSGAGSIFVSCDSAFTGGSPSATQRPSAAAEEPLLGSGPPAGPSHGAPCTGNPAVTHLVCDTTSNGFWCWSYDTGTRANNGALFMDPFTNYYLTPDVPFVFGTSDYTDATAVKTTFFKTRRRHNESGAAWVSVVVLADALMPHGVGNDPNDTAKVRLVALQYATSGQGYHGDSARLRFSSTNHANGTLYSVSATGDHVVAGKVALKGWDNTVPT